MEGFGRNERGVSEALGAILVFGLVLTLLMLVQMHAVPAANQQVEANHNERVQEDLGQLDGAITRTAMLGSGETVRLDTGVRYPARLLLYNPPPASGTVRTSAAHNVSLGNVSASGAAGAFLDGTERNVSTRALSYRADYRELDQPPTTVFETGVRYHRFQNGSVVERTTLVRGRTLTLVTLNGSLSSSSVDATMLETVPVSAPAQAVNVRNDTHPVRVTLPTKLSTAEWRETLTHETCADTDENFECDDPESDGHVVAIEENGSRTDVLLEKGQTYSLRMARVGVGRDVEERAEPRYVVPVRGNGTSVADGNARKLTVEVRDQFNNPVGDAEVTFETSDGTFGNTGGANSVTATTDEQGHASVTFYPDTAVSGNAKVVASRDYDASNAVERHERVEFTLDAGRPGPVVRTHTSTVDANGSRIVMGLKNDGALPVDIERVQLNYVTVNERVVRNVTVRMNDPTGAGELRTEPASIPITQLEDGPEEVTKLDVDGSDVGLDSSATEGMEPASLTQPQTLRPGPAVTVGFTFDAPLAAGEEDEFAMVSVTVYFSGGYTQTYTVHVDDDLA